MAVWMLHMSTHYFLCTSHIFQLKSNIMSAKPSPQQVPMTLQHEEIFIRMDAGARGLDPFKPPANKHHRIETGNPQRGLPEGFQGATVKPLETNINE